MEIPKMKAVDIGLDDIKNAEERIRAHVPPSPIKESFFLGNRIGKRTFLKLENLNLAGSFKIRGAVNALTQLSPDELKRGVVCSSAGNHAQGVAYAARLVGTHATIFMPVRSPLVKVESTRELGADVRLVGDSFDDAFAAAKEHEAKHGSILIHAFANRNVICGQGTAGLELFEQVPNLGLVIAAIGGGGMISGVACALKTLNPKIRVLGVQSEAYPAVQRSNERKTLISCSSGTTIADGIAIKSPSAMTLEMIDRYVDDIVTVDEIQIASAVMDLMERDHMLAEGAGAASVAALLALPASTFANLDGKAVACVISGGNMDVNLLARIIPNGLRYSGRHLRIAVRIPDRPGRLADLLNVVGRMGANLQEVEHNRLFAVSGFDDVEVQLDLETSNRGHQEAILEELAKSQFRVSVLS